MAESSTSSNIVLIGYRGSGKTTVGRLLAQRLGRPFVDTDERVAQRAGRSIRAIFDEQGEPAFRDIEGDVVREACALEGQVISVGGGAVLREENVERLRASGIVFWLRADAAVLWSRIARDAASTEQRPALTRLSGLLEVREVLAQREPLYRRAAHHELDAAGDPPEVIAVRITGLAEPCP